MNETIVVMSNKITLSTDKMIDLVSKSGINVAEVHRSQVRLSNGDRYIALAANDSARGHRANKAYVHVDTNKDKLDVLLPSILWNSGEIVWFE